MSDESSFQLLGKLQREAAAAAGALHEVERSAQVAISPEEALRKATEDELERLERRQESALERAGALSGLTTPGTAITPNPAASRGSAVTPGPAATPDPAAAPVDRRGEDEDALQRAADEEVERLGRAAQTLQRT